MVSKRRRIAGWFTISGDEDYSFWKNSTSLNLVNNPFLKNSNTGVDFRRWMQAMAKLRTSEEGTAVILVDWRNGARVKRAISFVRDYAHAASYVPLMGHALGALVRRLMITYSIHPDRVECIGFSLGAQIGGYFTRHLKQHRIKISRFVGQRPE